MNLRSFAVALTVGALAFGSLTTYAGPRTAVVSEDCKTTRGKQVDCTKQKCVNREGARVTACPNAAPTSGTAAPAQGQ